MAGEWLVWCRIVTTDYPTDTPISQQGDSNKFATRMLDGWHRANKGT